MIKRTVFESEHEMFRDSVRRFLAKEVVPHHEHWEEQGYVDRDVWLKAGEHGFLCPTMPEEYGGAGVDRLYSVVLMEEIARVNASGLGFSLHNEIIAPYVLHYGSEEQKKRLLPRMASGEMIGAIAMSEPAAGSDLQGIKTTAVAQDGGDITFHGFDRGVVYLHMQGACAGCPSSTLTLTRRVHRCRTEESRARRLGCRLLFAGIPYRPIDTAQSCR